MIRFIIIISMLSLNGFGHNYEKTATKYKFNELNLKHDHCRYPQVLKRETKNCECPAPLKKVGDECVCENCLTVNMEENYNEKVWPSLTEYGLEELNNNNEKEDDVEDEPENRIILKMNSDQSETNDMDQEKSEETSKRRTNRQLQKALKCNGSDFEFNASRHPERLNHHHHHYKIVKINKQGIPWSRLLLKNLRVFKLKKQPRLIKLGNNFKRFPFIRLPYRGVLLQTLPLTFYNSASFQIPSKCDWYYSANSFYPKLGEQQVGDARSMQEPGWHIHNGEHFGQKELERSNTSSFTPNVLSLMRSKQPGPVLDAHNEIHVSDNQPEVTYKKYPNFEAPPREVVVLEPKPAQLGSPLRKPEIIPTKNFNNLEGLEVVTETKSEQNTPDILLEDLTRRDLGPEIKTENAEPPKRDSKFFVQPPPMLEESTLQDIKPDANEIPHDKEPDSFSDSVIFGNTSGSITSGSDFAEGELSSKKGTGSIVLGTGGGSAGAIASTGQGLSKMKVRSKGAEAQGFSFVNPRARKASTSLMAFTGKGDAIATNTITDKGLASSAAVATQEIASAGTAAYGAAAASASATPGKYKSDTSGGSGKYPTADNTNNGGGAVAQSISVGNPNDSLPEEDSLTSEEKGPVAFDTQEEDDDDFYVFDI